jgi:hypothetical protein
MLVDVQIPEISEKVTSCSVVGVHVQTSDAFKVDDVLIELETDKSVMEIPSTTAAVAFMAADLAMAVTLVDPAENRGLHRSRGQRPGVQGGGEHVPLEHIRESPDPGAQRRPYQAPHRT